MVTRSFFSCIAGQPSRAAGPVSGERTAASGPWELGLSAGQEPLSEAPASPHPSSDFEDRGQAWAGKRVIQRASCLLSRIKTHHLCGEPHRGLDLLLPSGHLSISMGKD